MQIDVLKSKIHMVSITEANLHYIGSITIDEDLMDAANLIENEKVQVVNVNNGERIETYVIKGNRGSGKICLNGPAARKCVVGDVVVIMLLAVLEKRVGFKLASKDVFLNIAGGLKVTDPAIDLAVIAAILSSNLDAALPDDCCFAGEVGLSGEIRPVTRLDQRINEAAKLGFKRIFISGNLKNIAANSTIQIVTVGRVEHLVKHLFSKNQGE